MIYCGIDPGLQGAISFLEVASLPRTDRLTIYKMPLNDSGIDAHCLVMLLHNWKPDRLIIEGQFAVPARAKRGKMGNGSILTMGQNWGKIIGVAQALQIKTEIILPISWQSKMCPKKIFQFDDSKQRSLAAAKKYAPPGTSFVLPGETKESDGASDASLLAYYGSIYFPS